MKIVPKLKTAILNISKSRFNTRPTTWKRAVYSKRLTRATTRIMKTLYLLSMMRAQS